MQAKLVVLISRHNFERCGAAIQNPAKSKKCPKCKGDLAGLGKFARKMAEFNGFARKIAGEGLEAANDEGMRFKQQEVLRDLLQVGS